MRLLICAGGTGGGVYPALAVHGVLTSKVTDVETLWVGGEGGMEESLVKRQGIPFRSIPAAGVHGVSLAGSAAQPRSCLDVVSLPHVVSSMTSSPMFCSSLAVMWLCRWRSQDVPFHPFFMCRISNLAWL